MQCRMHLRGSSGHTPASGGDGKSRASGHRPPAWAGEEQLSCLHLTAWSSSLPASATQAGGRNEEGSAQARWTRSGRSVGCQGPVRPGVMKRGQDGWPDGCFDPLSGRLDAREARVSVWQAGVKRGGTLQGEELHRHRKERPNRKRVCDGVAGDAWRPNAIKYRNGLEAARGRYIPPRSYYTRGEGASQRAEVP